MKVKVSEATNIQLNWMVAKAEDYIFAPVLGCGAVRFKHGLWTKPTTTGAQTPYVQLQEYKYWLRKCEADPLLRGTLIWDPTTDWSQGGPLLSKERISRTIDHSGLWIAYWTDGYTEGDEGKLWMQCDRSELVAGLRCYVISKLGEEVEVPDELCDLS